jgi:hypothetical protein
MTMTGVGLMIRRDRARAPIPAFGLAENDE